MMLKMSHLETSLTAGITLKNLLHSLSLKLDRCKV